MKVRLKKWKAGDWNYRIHKTILELENKFWRKLEKNMGNKEGQMKEKETWLKDMDKITDTPERENRTEFKYKKL